MARLFPFSAPKLVTQTFTANATFTVPAGTTLMESVSGYGARGRSASSSYVQAYTRFTEVRQVYRDGSTSSSTVSSDYFNGPTPSDYCNAPVVLPPSTSPNVYSTQNCYSFRDDSYYDNSPATRGASATAFGKTFPGSLGNVAQTTTTFTNVAVTAGTSYSIIVPSGGSVTIAYLTN